MITVIETNKHSREAYGWFVDDLHPEWNRKQGIEFLANYFPSIDAREFAFFVDGEHAGYLSTTTGMNIHHGMVVDTFTVVKPDARNNRALLKAMLEQMKQVCREAGLQCYVRSIHLNETTTKVKYNYLGGS